MSRRSKDCSADNRESCAAALYKHGKHAARRLSLVTPRPVYSCRQNIMVTTLVLALLCAAVCSARDISLEPRPREDAHVTAFYTEPETSDVKLPVDIELKEKVTKRQTFAPAICPVGLIEVGTECCPMIDGIIRCPSTAARLPGTRDMKDKIRKRRGIGIGWRCPLGYLLVDKICISKMIDFDTSSADTSDPDISDPDTSGTDISDPAKELREKRQLRTKFTESYSPLSDRCPPGYVKVSSTRDGDVMCSINEEGLRRKREVKSRITKRGIFKSIECHGYKKLINGVITCVTADKNQLLVKRGTGADITKREKPLKM